MIKLTQAQRELLARAAADPEGVADAPQDPKLRRPLIKHGLAIGMPAAGDAVRLVITNAGRALLAPDVADTEGEGSAGDTSGVEDAPATAAGTSASVTEGGEPPPGVSGPAAPSRAPKGRLGKLVELLSRSDGATLDEMVAATGWQKHSVRGAMSGGLKKKFGCDIVSTKTDGTRVYRITSGDAA
jgi:hypothetical protein